jgi:TetR/AcrR family transcriptional repressor of bet genes
MQDEIRKVRLPDRRQQILGAVAACVSEEGIAGVTLRKVAKRAGATTGMLTHYYQNKTALLKDASLSAERSLRNRILDRAGSGPSLDWLLTYIEESLQPEAPGSLPWTFWLEFWSYAAREPELARHYETRSRRQIAEIARSIQACIDAGIFRPGLKADDAATTIFALTNGLGVASALAQEPTKFSVVRGAIDAVLEGFRVPPLD